MENRVYLFVPFRFDRNGKLFSTVFKCARMVLPKEGERGAPDGWYAFAHKPTSYFLKYFTDKIDYCGEEKKDSRAVAIGKVGAPVGCIYHLFPLEKLRDDFKAFQFIIQSINLFVFKTGVGLVSFGIEVDADSVKDVAEAEFLLKQAAERKGEDGKQIQIGDEKRRTTFLELARNLVQSLLGAPSVDNGDDGFSFFSEKPRASMLTWVLNDGSTSTAYDEEFYYLRNGYGGSYYYSDELKGGLSMANGLSQVLGDGNVRWGGFPMRWSVVWRTLVFIQNQKASSRTACDMLSAGSIC